MLQKKIDRIYQYFIANPNRMITASEVAKALNIKPGVVVTTLNRLVKSGVLQKVRRGIYMYSVIVDTDTLDLNEVHTIIYKCFVNTVGEKFFTEVDIKFNADKGWDCIKQLVNIASSYFGRKFISEIIRAHLSNFYKPSEVNFIFKMIGLGLHDHQL
jgi:predicted transcriptional regulator